MVYGIRYMVYGIRYMVYGIWYSIWYMVQYMVIVICNCNCNFRVLLRRYYKVNVTNLKTIVKIQTDEKNTYSILVRYTLYIITRLQDYKYLTKISRNIITLSLSSLIIFIPVYIKLFFYTAPS